MSTPEPAIDLDLIAAFIDGRLGPADRERAMTLLATSDAAFDVFVEATRAGAETGDSVIPIDRARRWWGGRRPAWWVLAPAAAAAVLLFMVLPKAWVGSERNSAVPATALVGALGGADLRVATSAGWQERGWSVTRGAASSLADSTTAFRLGVRAFDLRVAVIADDRASADRLVAEMLDRLSSVQFSQFVVVRYSNLRRDIGGTQREQLLARASQADSALGALLAGRPDDIFWFNFGKWSAAAELAAGARSRAFFKSDLSTRLVRDALERAGGTRGDTTDLRRASDLARANATDRDFELERDALRSLIKKHAE
jgi:hypothetical protein